MCSSHSCTFVMASRSIVGPQETEMLEMNSYIRGYHVYKVVWEATCGDVLRLEREYNNKRRQICCGCSKLERVIQSRALFVQM